MFINAKLNRKDSEVEFKRCSVDEIIELEEEEFSYFCKHLLDDYSFIADRKDMMGVDEDGIPHCLLVLGKSSDDGVLVESEGSDYARYSCFIPNARDIVENQCIAYFSTAPIDLPEEVFLDESDNTDIEVMCAKHVLWLYDEADGEQMKLDGYRIDNNDFVGKNLCSIDFGNGKFNNCSFEDASLCFSSARSAVFNNCNFTGATIEESEFYNCRFVNCKLNSALFTHSDLSNCEFKGCDFYKASFRYALLEDMLVLSQDGSVEEERLPNSRGAYFDREEWENELDEGVVQE